jgi:hypothetical protein
MMFNLAGPVGPLEIVAGIVILLGWVIPLVYWIKIKRAGRNSNELRYVALFWGLAAVVTVFVHSLAILLVVGWLVVLIVGLVRLDTPRVGRILVTMGALWGLVILGLGPRVVNTLAPSDEWADGTTPFNAATFTGPKGTVELGIKDLKSISAFSTKDMKTYSYSPKEGKIEMPAGQHRLIEIHLAKADTRGNLWDVTGSPRPGVPFEVKQGKTPKLPASGAITASLSLDMKSGRQLALSFALKDASGAKWRLSGPPGTDPRFVALDKADKQVWQGKFAYG